MWLGPRRVGAGTSWVRARTRCWFQGLVVIQVPTALSSGRICGCAGAESWTQRSCFLKRGVWLMSSGTAEAASWHLALSMFRSTVRPGLDQGTRGGALSTVLPLVFCGHRWIWCGLLQGYRGRGFRGRPGGPEDPVPRCHLLLSHPGYFPTRGLSQGEIRLLYS